MGEKTKPKIIVSISLLVSNSIEYIEKCMESIVPILTNIPSELIVVDTGGTDGSIEVAKKYADYVVPFTWCDDFAAARNAGLEKARGEWFLFLDDDEWFENVDEIVDFFKSGEYDNYNCASYRIRNYADLEGKKWSEVRTVRMAKRTETTRFVSKIHEYLMPTLAPEKRFEVFVHHYGYVYSSDKKEREHFKRNVNLIKQGLQENPQDLRLIVQLAQEYSAIREHQASEDICLEWIEKYQGGKPRDNAYVGWLIYNVIQMEIAKRDMNQAYEYVKRFVELNWINTITVLCLMYFATLLCEELGKTTEMVAAAKTYLKIYEKVSKNLSAYSSEIILSQGEMVKDDAHWTILQSLLRASVKNNKNDIAHKSMLNILSSEKGINNKATIESLLQLCDIEKDNKIKERIIRKIVVDSNDQKLLIMLLDADNSEHILSTLCNVIAGKLENDTFLNQFWVIKVVNSGENTGEIGELVEKIISNTNPYELCSAFWVAIDSITVDYNSCFLKHEMENWVNKTNAFIGGADQHKIFAIYNALCKCDITSNQLCYTILACVGSLLRNDFDSREFDVEQIMADYVRLSRAFYGQFVISGAENSELVFMLPKAYRFAIKMSEAEACINDIIEYAKTMKEAAEIYPDMATACKRMITIQRDKMSKSKSINKEFTDLSRIVKAKAKELIESRQFLQALDVVTQLKEMLPNDEEVCEMEDYICGVLKDTQS